MGEKTAPKSQLRLEWVYGYRGHQTRNNLCYNGTKDVIFFVAGVGVVYNVKENHQKFFLGHDDDILCQSLHPDKVLVATGQVGKKPYICVWNSMTQEAVSFLKDGHQNGVASVAFSKDGTRLVSVGLDQHATINAWDWKKGKIIATVRGHSDRVFDVQYNPFTADTVVSCGVKHIKFWTSSGNNLSCKKGVFGKVGDIQTMLCMAFAPDNITYTGTLSGDIYVWLGNNLQRVIQAAHQGAIYAVDSTDEGYATGGKDGCVRLWDTDFKPITTVNLVDTREGYQGLCVRSVCWRGEYVLVGTQDSEVFEITAGDWEKPQCLIQGHAEGELWALAVHSKKPIFATGSDDCTIRLWNAQNKQILSKTTLDNPIRSCAFNDDGTQIAIGMTDGSLVVLKTRDLSEIVQIKDRKEVIHEMKYSPDGNFLAAGSNDNFVDIYSVSQRYRKVGQCSGSSSFITHLDWSEDSKYLQTNSGAAERLFFRMPNGKQVVSKEEIENIHWATFTGVLGPEVTGIWEKYTDTTDINAADAFFGSNVIVTGDDFGLVKLFKFPSLKKGAKFRKYVGHSAHVTNCRFTSDKQRVITTGGADHAIFQWKFLPDGMNTADDLPEQLAYADSNSEDSDSDMSDVAELDSDVEGEKQLNYDREVYKDDLLVIKKSAAANLKSGLKRKKAPNYSLKLEYVHGYRGYDCRNNVVYTLEGEVVYHVAAVGIVYNKEKHKQRFYTEHTDDILCLARNPIKNTIATGQVGRDPTIHIWDSDTMKTISILKGHHQRGVCACDFTEDGKKLATVGLDDNHTIVVWDWKKGEKLATTRGHKDKIFQIKWNPHETNKLVTVGVKHIKFWTQAGGGFTSNRGVFGNVAKVDSMLCVVYGRKTDICITGGANGRVYIWTGTSLANTVKAHEGPVFSMHSLDKGFVTGGKDGIVSLWDEQFERCLKSYPIKKSSLATDTKGVLVKDFPAVRALILGHGCILVGTKQGEVLEIDKSGPISVLAQGHGEGELWGLATHPNQPLIASVSDDKTLRIWSLTEEHKMMKCKMLDKPARCVSFSPGGKAVAIGYKDGSFNVVNYETMEEIVQFHHRKQEISDIRFSPDPGKYLAVGSHDNMIDIYNVLNSKRVGVCKGSSSYITHIDWDKSGKLLMSNSGAKEQLFFEAPRGKRQVLRSADVDKVNWDSWTCVLGQSCEGIWPPGCDVTDVNAASLTSDKAILATGDDFGFVKMFEYPVKGQHAKCKKYQGHSAHVTNVRWTNNNSQLVSAGGADTAIMVWSLSNRLEQSASKGDSDDSDTDSEEDGGYDSDVAREKNMDYSSKIYANPIRNTNGVKPCNQDYQQEEKAAVSRKLKEKPKVKIQKQHSASSKRHQLDQVRDLELDYIFGYRGFDCRCNAHYLNDGSDIVFHAAGAGITQNISSANQTFYLEHTDDIISLAVNGHPKFKNVIATGQIGNVPEVRVWDAVSKKTLSIIKGFHTKGVCSLNFSCSGKFLVTVGLEDGHSVAVWRWQEGSKVAGAAGHSNRIFHAEFRPDSDSHFVTVGVKHVKFWTVAGGELVGKKGVLSNIPGVQEQPKMQTMLSVAFGADNTAFTGAMSGDVYVWKDNVLSRMIQKAHNGPIFSMFTTLRDGLIVTGAKEKKGKEGAVKLWDQEMKRFRAFSVDTKDDTAVVKSVSRCKGKILIGTKQSEFLEINEKTGSSQMIVCGHGEGEIWGLSVHPTMQCFVTASDDGTVRLWDITNKSMVHQAKVGEARSTHISPDAELISVGLKNGGIVILNAKTFKVWGQKRDRNQMINDIRFSPDSRLLAVGSEEGSVDIYDITMGPSLNRLCYCKGISGFVAKIDFSDDSKFIKVSTGAYKTQIFDTVSGNEITDTKILKTVTWNSWTSVLGNEVVGIWPQNSDKLEVNCANVSHSGNTVATGDDNGYVKLFKFPCSEKYATHKTYMGHSAHVTNVWFTQDDKYLISTGGDDCCVFVWRCK